MDALVDKRHDFTIVDNSVVRDTKNFSKNELLAYVALSSFANTQGTCFPSYDEIARIMRTSKRTAIEGVQGLVEKGVIQVENRKEDKKKQMKSNLYTLVCVRDWEQTVIDNRRYLLSKAIDYKKRLAKSNATKNSKKNTPEVVSDLPSSVPIELNVDFNSDSSISKEEPVDTYSIPQDSTVFPEKEFDKNRQNMTENEKLLRESGIKYIPYIKEKEVIDSLDAEILKEAIEITMSKAQKPNWKYLLDTYDTVSFKSRQVKKSETKQENSNLKGGLGMCNSTIFMDGEYKRTTEIDRDKLEAYIDDLAMQSRHAYFEKYNQEKLA